MARPLRIEFPGAFYHIISRGDERKEIFIDDKGHRKILSYSEMALTHYKKGGGML